MLIRPMLRLIMDLVVQPLRECDAGPVTVEPSVLPSLLSLHLFLSAVVCCGVCAGVCVLVCVLWCVCRLRSSECVCVCLCTVAQLTLRRELEAPAQEKS